MAGRGRVPKPADQRRRTPQPQRGEWQPTPEIGWQHGPIPDPPDGLMEPARQLWQDWMTAWFASHWIPADLENLRMVISLFDRIQRNLASPTERTEYRQLIDNFGISPKGQQDRRWARPKLEEPQPEGRGASHYANLQVVG